MVSAASILTLFGVLLGCLLIGIPIAFSLGLSGIVTILTSLDARYMLQIPVTLDKVLSDFVFVAIPLYVLMGEILYHGKSGERLFWLASAMLKRMRWGVGVAAVAAFTFFAAIVGSSMASVLSIGKIALPEMRKYNYSKTLAYGLTAVGGSLGMLIPPSMAFILYASLTGVSPSKLFIAGVIPGLLIASMLTIFAIVRAPKVPPEEYSIYDRKVDIREILKIIPDLFLPVFILGGIYAGAFTPVEAAGVGVVYALIVNLFIQRSIKWKDLPRICMDAVRSSAFLLSIVAGAIIFGQTLTNIGLPQFLSDKIGDLGMAPWVVLLIMNLIWLVMGFFLEGASITLITTPIFFPVAQSLGFDPVWFGVLLVLNMELAVITPPVGVNLFAIKSLLPDEPLEKIIVHTLPSTLFVFITLALVWIFPELALALL